MFQIIIFPLRRRRADGGRERERARAHACYTICSPFLLREPFLPSQSGRNIELRNMLSRYLLLDFQKTLARDRGEHNWIPSHAPLGDRSVRHPWPVFAKCARELYQAGSQASVLCYIATGRPPHISYAQQYQHMYVRYIYSHLRCLSLEIREFVPEEEGHRLRRRHGHLCARGRKRFPAEEG